MTNDSQENVRQSTPFLGCSPATELVRHEIELAARSSAKVLITGETGVGKEVVARLIHDRGRRRSAPFIAINCAGVPNTLLESEFFGHARGSFTGAYREHPGLLREADGGTVFLDEVGEMTARLQGLLLRFLENGEVQMIGGRTDVVNVRLIAATHRDLLARADAGDFRLDLFYRLNVVHIDISPLRSRREDIPVLVDHLLGACAREHGRVKPSLQTDALAALQAYDWPGNVRQLRNVLERIVVRADSAPVTVSDLPVDVVRTATATPPPSTRVDLLWHRLIVDHESFWTSVYPLFKSRELTRDELRALVAAGLKDARGLYRVLLSLFNMPSRDYKRFLNFLVCHDCKLPSKAYRVAHSDLQSKTPGPLDAD